MGETQEKRYSDNLFTYYGILEAVQYGIDTRIITNETIEEYGTLDGLLKLLDIYKREIFKADRGLQILSNHILQIESDDEMYNKTLVAYRANAMLHEKITEQVEKERSNGHEEPQQKRQTQQGLVYTQTTQSPESKKPTQTKKSEEPKAGKDVTSTYLSEEEVIKLLNMILPSADEFDTQMQNDDIQQFSQDDIMADIKSFIRVGANISINYPVPIPKLSKVQEVIARKSVDLLWWLLIGRIRYIIKTEHPDPRYLLFMMHVQRAGGHYIAARIQRPNEQDNTIIIDLYDPLPTSGKDAIVDYVKAVGTICETYVNDEKNSWRYVVNWHVLDWQKNPGSGNLDAWINSCGIFAAVILNQLFYNKVPLKRPSEECLVALRQYAQFEQETVLLWESCTDSITSVGEEYVAARIAQVAAQEARKAYTIAQDSLNQAKTAEAIAKDAANKAEALSAEANKLIADKGDIDSLNELDAQTEQQLNEALKAVDNAKAAADSTATAAENASTQHQIAIDAKKRIESLMKLQREEVEKSVNLHKQEVMDTVTKITKTKEEIDKVSKTAYEHQTRAMTAAKNLTQQAANISTPMSQVFRKMFTEIEPKLDANEHKIFPYSCDQRNNDCMVYIQATPIQMTRDKDTISIKTVVDIKNNAINVIVLFEPYKNVQYYAAIVSDQREKKSPITYALLVGDPNVFASLKNVKIGNDTKTMVKIVKDWGRQQPKQGLSLAYLTKMFIFALLLKKENPHDIASPPNDVLQFFPPDLRIGARRGFGDDAKIFDVRMFSRNDEFASSESETD